MTLSQLPVEEIIARIERTRPEGLRATAKAFEVAADELFQVRGRMNGVVDDARTLWDSTAGRSFGLASDQVIQGLVDVGYTLGYLGRQLRAHADATDEARAKLQPFRVPHPPAGAHPYFHPDAIKQSQVDAIAVAFHDSEIRVRKALFSWGEEAPGGIPVPELPAKPEQSWWEGLLFGPGPDPTWLDEDGDPLPMGSSGEGGYGYDEDGNLVPAHQAAYPGEHYFVQMSGVPFGAIFRFLRRAPRSPIGLQSGDDLAHLVRNSEGYRWQHIDRHVAEFYNLRLPTEGPEAGRAPAWAREEFLRTIQAAGEHSGKVFRWTLPPEAGQTTRQPTYAILYRDPKTNQWLAVQFFHQGHATRPLDFATAFRPTPSQINRMLQENAIT